MVRGVRDLQDQIAIVERHAAASVQSLHHIRARTSRVLAATSAFTALEVEARSLSQAARNLASLARVNDESVDRPHVERELARLRADMQALQLRFSSELTCAAQSEPASRRSPPSRPKRWWRFWS